MDINVAFSRALLRVGTTVMKKHFPHMHVMRDAWVWSAGDGNWKFNGPDKFQWHGRAGNAYDARYKGWVAWMEKQGVKAE